MSDESIINSKYQVLSGRLDEGELRIWVAVEARSLGRGGVSAVARAIGVSRTTIYAGLAELKAEMVSGVVETFSRSRDTVLEAVVKS